MYQINDNTKLCSLTIPGTHDTGATSGSAVGAKCQTASIKSQLESGIRFLDIRLRPSGTRLEVCHGIIGMGIYFEEDVMNICKEFLGNNPTETIFMSIKLDDGSSADYLSLLNTSLNSPENQSFLLKSVTPSTTLGNARGKIVCFHRNKPNWNYYGYEFNGFSDNTTFSNNLNSYYGTTTSFKAQDYYSISKGALKGVDYDGKADAITALLDESYNNTANKWFINFLSGTAMANLANPETVAKKIGPRIMTYLQGKGFGNYGVVLMDFANSKETSGPELTNFLINCNNKYADFTLNNIKKDNNAELIINVVDGEIMIQNSDEPFEVYTLTGIKTSNTPPRGVYIVKVNNKAIKVKI